MKECAKVSVPKNYPNGVVIRDADSGKYLVIHRNDMFEHRYLAMRENKRRKIKKSKLADKNKKGDLL